MTISSETRRAGPFTGNDSTTSFPFEFKVFDESDLRVVFTDADGVDSDLVLDSDYSVTLNADQNTDPGGTITYPISGAELSTDETLTVVSDISYTQETDITNGGGFYPQIVENALDKLLAQIQQVKEMLDRAPLVSVSSSLADLVFPSPGASQYIRWNAAGTALEAVSSTVSAGAFLQSGTGAVEREANAKMGETISVADFDGFDPTGGSDSTAAVQAAIDYVESLDGGTITELVFPPGAVVDITQVFVTSGKIKLNGNGCQIVQNHDAANSTTVGGAGQYKVSAAIFIKRGAADVEITGFDFTTDDASFPAFASGYGSYFPSIGGQAFTRVNIHHNLFRGGQRRALFTQGGKYLTFEKNYVQNCGITVHVGYTANQLFYDTTTDITGKYSPFAPWIINNVFDGYTSTDVTTCLFLTGAIKFTVCGNKLLNMNEATALRPLMVYCNDYGPYDEDGTARAYIEGDVVGNTIGGTYKDALEVRGLAPNGVATWTGAYEMRVNVERNKITGTGNGIKLQEVYNTKVKRNYVQVTASPLYCDQRIVHVDVTENHLQSTLNGYDDTTIYLGWAVGSGGFTFEKNRVHTPTASVYAMRSVTAATWADINRNYWFFDADGASCRMVVLTIASRLRFNHNTVNVETDTANITALVFTGTGTRSQVEIIGNDTVAVNGTGAATFRFCSVSGFYDVHIDKNTTAGGVVIESCYRVWVDRNNITLPASTAIRGVFVDNSALNARTYVWATGNYVVMPTGLSSPGIGVASYDNATNNTTSKITMNVVIGDSAGALISQTTHGTLEHIGNTIINTGGGGTSVAVTGSASAVAL